jgi:hypothetical protein
VPLTSIGQMNCVQRSPLSHVHPTLFDLPQFGAPLWPSLHRGKRQMGASGIYARIGR